MAILKTEAIVLKGWKMGETSKIISFYTKDFGKVRAVAKGARDIKSKFKGCLEPLTHVRIIYYDKRTRDLQLLSQIDLVEPHLGLIGHMEKTTLGLAAAELIDRAVVGEESFPAIFDLLADTLITLTESEGFLESVFWYFQTHFIGLMGYEPSWDACISCQGSLGASGGYFQPESGGLFCERCGNVRGGLKIRGETLEIMYWLQKCPSHEVSQLTPDPANIAEIRRMYEQYFRVHIEHLRKLRSLKLYYNLKQNG
ncbi:DNA repair protein RecO [bacterium I07]|nr:DNA repair protein RecO [bacterium I07]